MSTAVSSSRRCASRLPRARKRSATAAPRDPPLSTASVTVASKQRSGPPVSIGRRGVHQVAADRARASRRRASPRARSASASAVKRSRITRRATISQSWVTSAPRRTPPPPVRSIPRSSSMPWIAIRCFAEAAPSPGGPRRRDRCRRRRGRAPGCSASASSASSRGLPAGSSCAHQTSSPAWPPRRARGSWAAAARACRSPCDRVGDRSRRRDAGRLADTLRALRPGVHSASRSTRYRSRARRPASRACSRAGAGSADVPGRRTACPRCSA